MPRFSVFLVSPSLCREWLLLPTCLRIKIKWLYMLVVTISALLLLVRPYIAIVALSLAICGTCASVVKPPPFIAGMMVLCIPPLKSRMNTRYWRKRNFLTTGLLRVEVYAEGIANNLSLAPGEGFV
ncbi:unnamed protein product [Ectocarpus sp. 12 AP-2014]